MQASSRENSPDDTNHAHHSLTLDSKPSIDPPSMAPSSNIWLQSQDKELFILCLKVKYWALLLVALQFFSLIIMLASLCTPHWVKQRDDYREWEGGLLVCSDCPDKYDGDTYADIADNDDVCDESSLDGMCSTIEELRDAGSAFAGFTIIAITFLIVWFGRTAMLLCKRRFRLLCALAWPILTFLFFLTGFIVWTAVSKAKFEDVDNCDKLSSEHREDVCATDGPGLALFNVFLLLGLGGVDVAMYTAMSLKSQS
mmetsp:Transcript_16034/g.29380  ORF Transcript_16034/g.29380 Transcript_16034/m.29380 type:complete len:255 (+) Transcript_16034:1087-1851(+)